MRGFRRSGNRGCKFTHQVHMQPQGSLFSALLTDMMEAVRWPAQAPQTGSPNGSPRCSPPRAATGAAAASASMQVCLGCRTLQLPGLSGLQDCSAGPAGCLVCPMLCRQSLQSLTSLKSMHMTCYKPWKNNNDGNPALPVRSSPSPPWLRACCWRCPAAPRCTPAAAPTRASAPTRPPSRPSRSPRTPSGPCTSQARTSVPAACLLLCSPP